MSRRSRSPSRCGLTSISFRVALAGGLPTAGRRIRPAARCRIDAGESAGNVRGSVDCMSEPEFHRDRRQHGGAAQRLDDDKLAELTEDERVDAGLDDFNPDEVPPATDPLPQGVPQRTDVRQSAEYKDAQAEIDREEKAGELGSLDVEHPFPPTHYDNS